MQSTLFRPIPRTVVPFAVLTSVLWNATSPVRAQDPTFIFNPPPVLTYLRTHQYTLTEVVPNKGRIVSTQAGKFKTVMKRTPEGYRVTETLISGTATRNGKPVKDSLYAAMRNKPVTVDLDSTGKVMRVVNLDAVYKVVAAWRRRASMEPMTRERLEQNIRSDWDDDYAHLVNRSARAGSSWTAPGDLMLSIGELVPGASTYRVIGDAKCPTGDCVLVRVTGEPEMDSVKLIVEDQLAKGMNLSQMPGMKLDLLDLSVTETGDLILRPSTLEFVSSSSRSDLTFNADVGGEITVPIQIQSRSWDKYQVIAPGKTVATPAKPKPKAKPKVKPRRR